MANILSSLVQGNGINARLRFETHWDTRPKKGYIRIACETGGSWLPWGKPPRVVMDIWTSYNPHALGKITVNVYHSDIQEHTITILKEQLLEFAQEIPTPIIGGIDITYEPGAAVPF